MPDPNADTQELLSLAATGDGEAFGCLLGRFRERLLGRIRMMLGSEARRRADSEDFLNGVLAEALAHFQKRGIRTERDFLRWLTTVARNDIRDAVRRPREEAFETLSVEILGVVSSKGEDPLEEVVRLERVHRLLEALEDLADDQRQVIELRNLEGLGLDAIAERMQRGRDAVRMLHVRAMMKLGERMHREA